MLRHINSVKTEVTSVYGINFRPLKSAIVGSDENVFLPDYERKRREYEPQTHDQNKGFNLTSTSRLFRRKVHCCQTKGGDLCTETVKDD